MSEVLRDTNLLYTLAGSGRHCKGVEQQENRIAVHFAFRADVTEREREQIIHALRVALDMCEWMRERDAGVSMAAPPPSATGG